MYLYLVNVRATMGHFFIAILTRCTVFLDGSWSSRFVAVFTLPVRALPWPFYGGMGAALNAAAPRRRESGFAV